MAEMGGPMQPEHPLRHCAHIDWLDYYDEKPRPQPEQFECPRCSKSTTKNICNGGTKADTAYCSNCRIEFAIIPTWHERLMELKADEPGKVLRDDHNTITFNATTQATNPIVYINTSNTNCGTNTWTIT